MKFRPEAGIGLAALAVIVMWPFWQAHAPKDSPGAAFEEIPAPATAQEPPASVSEEQPAQQENEKDRPVCSACSALERLARRLRAREEGAARRFEAAAGRLSAAPEKGRAAKSIRTELELALRHAQDDKRGAAAFRAAALRALDACRVGPGCGEAPLSEFWVGGCPPEHPDLAREMRALAQVNSVIARKAAACASTACPEIDCERQAHIVRLLSDAGRSLKALSDLPGRQAGFAAAKGNAVLPLLAEAGAWRTGVAALFLGGPDPAAQIAASADAARMLASRLGDVRTPVSPAGAAHDPFWRAHVLSIRLERVAGAMTALAAAVASEEADRDPALSRARQRAAAAFRDLLVAQMRFESALGMTRSDRTVTRTCDGRRRAQIARAQGQIRALRAALGRCAGRARCLKRAKRSRSFMASGLDPVSAERFRLDRALEGLDREARALTIEAQKPVTIDTVRSRYQNGEAVPVRIDLRATACMADDNAWVGLFPAEAPPLRGGEAAHTAIRRLGLRGRPWEEILFEAPGRPGAYEVRSYAPEVRGGDITGRARFEVEKRPQGCRGFTGVWRTNFGRLQITVRDGEARGSYKREGTWRAGFLTGKVNGRVLLGDWQSDLGAGGTRLVLSEDGKTLSGTWSHFRDEFAGTGVWTGKCEGAVLPQDDPQPD